MLTSIDVQFIFDGVRLGLSSSANILQIADVSLRVVFLLFLPWGMAAFFLFFFYQRVNTKWHAATVTAELQLCVAQWTQTSNFHWFLTI